MIALDHKHLLMIEPRNQASTEPTIDELSTKMTSLIAMAIPGDRWKGWHTCVCGAHSGSDDLVLPDGTITNSLASHYLERHRDEVPQGELDKLAMMQLNPPNKMLSVYGERKETDAKH